MRNQERPLFFALALTVTASFIPATAIAGEAESRTLFAEGRKLREEHKCADAVVVFRKAMDTFPDGLGSLRNIAECEQEIGWLASARRDWNDLKVAVLQSNSPKYEGWDKDADAAYRALESRVARVTLKLTGAAPEDLRIQVNGKPFDQRLVGTELEEDTGKMRVEVYYGGKHPVVKEVDVVEGTRGTVEIQVPKVEHKEAGPTGPTGPSPEELAAQENRRKTRKSMQIGGGVALAVGGLGFIGMGAAIGVRQSAVSDVDGICKSHDHCSHSQKLDDAVSKGNTASTLVNVFAVTGGVGAGVGIILLAAAPSVNPAPKKTGIQLQFAPTVGGGYFGATGRF